MLAERIRRIREIRGLKQAHVATGMNVTQQAYSEFETNNENPKLQTLIKFCRVTNVPLSLLLSFDLPITEDVVNYFTHNNLTTVLNEHRSLKNKLLVFEELVQRIGGTQLSVG